MDGRCTRCVEVVCRGHVSQSFEWMCKVLGQTKEERKEVKYEVEKTALHCSHAIVAAHIRRDGYQSHCWMYPNGAETIRFFQ